MKRKVAVVAGLLAAGTIILLARGVAPYASAPPAADPGLVALDLDRPCGPVSACTALRLIGRQVGLDEACRHVPADYAGRTTMSDLVAGLQSMGVAAVGVRLGPDALGRLPRGVPVILFTQGGHFTAALPTPHGGAVLINPPAGTAVGSRDELRSMWSGETVLVAEVEGALRAACDSAGVR